MPGRKRSYRKNLTSYGLIYLSGEELEISVRNLSLTGLLAELQSNDSAYETKSIFQAIELTMIVDIYLPEMRVAGEAEITRSDMSDGKMYLALEFRNLTYEVSNLLYKRRAYRKNMTAPGNIDFHGKTYSFFTKNVSVDGMTIMLNQYVVVHEGLSTMFEFKKLGLRGQIKVIWVDYLADDSTIMGLQYVEIKRDDISGVPQFLPSNLDGY
jgi:hypothetical protein